MSSRGPELPSYTIVRSRGAGLRPLEDVDPPCGLRGVTDEPIMIGIPIMDASASWLEMIYTHIEHDV